MFLLVSHCVSVYFHLLYRRHYSKPVLKLFFFTFYFLVLRKRIATRSTLVWWPSPFCLRTRLVRFSTTNRAFRVRVCSSWKKNFFSLRKEPNLPMTTKMKISGKINSLVMLLAHFFDWSLRVCCWESSRLRFLLFWVEVVPIFSFWVSC